MDALSSGDSRSVDSSSGGRIGSAWRSLSGDEQDAWLGFARLFGEVTRLLDEHLQEAHGISLTEFDVLMTVYLAGGPVRIARLADATLLTRSGATRAVQRLVERDLLARETGANSRQVSAALTAQGRRALEAAAPEHVQRLREVFLHRLPPGGSAALAYVWRELLPGPQERR